MKDFIARQKSMFGALREATENVLATRCPALTKSASVGQGTVEYAIIVGVLVVIAILAITVFSPKIQELWDAISAGINGL